MAAYPKLVRILFGAALLSNSGCGSICGVGEKRPVPGKMGLSVTTETLPLKKINETNIVVHLVPEQDPNGFFWGLRDTISGKLLLNYAYQRIWNFENGYAMIQLDNKFGMVNSRGKVIVDAIYDLPRIKMTCGLVAFENGYGPMLIFDSTGTGVLPSISEMSGFLPCEKRITYRTNRYGMTDLTGDTILPFIFKEAFLVPEGFCIASRADQTGHNYLYGMYDLDGREVLPHEFERIDAFYNGRSIVKKRDKIGIVDEGGKILRYTDYVRIDRYKNGYAIVYKKSDQLPDDIRVGIIDRNGHEVVPPVYQWLDQVYNFNEGMVAMAQNGKYGFLNTKAEVVVPFKYDRVEAFDGGIAKVWLGWRYAGYINKKGEEIIAPVFEAMDQANLRRFHSRFIIAAKDSVQFVFDYAGKLVTRISAESISEFNARQRSFLVLKKGKWGVLDSNFKTLIPIQYESLDQIFSNGIAVRKNGKFGFINHAGKMILPCEYDSMEPYQDGYMNAYDNGLVKLGKGGKFAVMNSYWKLVLPFKYEEINDFSHGFAVVKRDGHYGFVDRRGKQTTPMIYDAIAPFNGDVSQANLKGETFYIDSLGKRIEEEY